MSNKMPIRRPFWWILKNTIFRQFCGGESLADVKSTVTDLKKLGVNSILDYAVESDSISTSKDLFENLKSSINFAGSPDVKGTRIAVKLSAIIPFDVLENLSREIVNVPPERLSYIGDHKSIQNYLEKLCLLTELCQSKNVKIAVDAEHHVIQPAIDRITLYLMARYNSHRNVFVSNTYQMYLKGAFERMSDHYQLFHYLKRGFGVKLVRGAYLGHQDKNSPNGYGPILNSIEETHAQFDKAINVVVGEWILRTDHIATDVMIATHNSQSIKLAVDSLKESAISDLHEVSFAQLLGMQDQVTYSLALSGYNVYKYVPFGPVSVSLPYLARRMQENCDVFKTRSEIDSIRKELVCRIMSFT